VKKCWMLWMAVAVVGLLAGEVMAAGTSTGAAKVGEKPPPAQGAARREADAARRHATAGPAASHRGD